jgi:hypothetical protein
MVSHGPTRTFLSQSAIPRAGVVFAARVALTPVQQTSTGSCTLSNLETGSKTSPITLQDLPHDVQLRGENTLAPHLDLHPAPLLDTWHVQCNQRSAKPTAPPQPKETSVYLIKVSGAPSPSRPRSKNRGSRSRRKQQHWR